MPRDTLRTPIVLIPVELAAAALYEIDASVPDLAPAALVGTATAVLDEARDLVVEMDRHLAADLPVAVSGDPLLSEEMADTMAVVAGAIGVFNVTIQALQNLDMSGFSEPDI